MEAASPRQRLLDAVVDVALAGGITDKSLRAVAEAAGTSHRMLIHHFGSREALLVEVTRAVEERQRARLSGVPTDPPSDHAAAAWQFWEQLCDPELAPQERLFFEIYGQALQGREWARPLLDGVVDQWIGPMAELLRAGGAPPHDSAVRARLAVAVARGLLLDLLATGDRTAVDAAMACFARMVLAPDEDAPPGPPGPAGRPGTPGPPGPAVPSEAPDPPGPGVRP